MKKLYIADTLTDFREVDLSDLYVEALSGTIFSNQYGFDKNTSTWILLGEMKLPDVLTQALKQSPNNFERPITAPDGFELAQAASAQFQAIDFEAIAKLIRDEVAGLRQEMNAKLDSITNQTGVISDLNKKVSKVLVSSKEKPSESDDQEYVKKFNNLKIKYKNLAVENKLAKKNLAKVITKARALNAKLEVAEKELEHFKNYTDKRIDSDRTGEFDTPNEIEESVNSASVSDATEETTSPTVPNFQMISRDELVLESDDLVQDYSDESEEATGEFDVGVVHAATSRAQIDDEELESLNLAGLKNGKSYEIINKKTWQYDTGAGVVGPLRFDEILEDFENGKLTDDTPVKKKVGAAWIPARDCLELNTEAELIHIDETNIEKNKYLIERTEYRVELQEVISFSLGGLKKEFKGYLSNLSLSGGFIEVTQFEDSLIKGGRGTLFISEGTFSRAVAIDFTIMRTSKHRPKGLGIRFESVSDTILEVIGECMINILNNIESNDKAA